MIGVYCRSWMMISIASLSCAVRIDDDALHGPVAVRQVVVEELQPREFGLVSLRVRILVRVPRRVEIGGQALLQICVEFVQSVVGHQSTCSQ